MCEPVSISLATLAIGVASAVASYAQAQQQQASQNAYQEAQAKEYAKAAVQNNQAAIREYVEQSAAERTKQMQEQQATSMQLQEQQIERLRNQGTAIASSNAAGGALQMLMGDFERQEAENRNKIHAAYANTSVNSNIMLNTYKDKAQNRIDSQQDYVYMQSDNTMGNTLGLALGIGGAAVGAADKYFTNKAKTEPGASK